MRRRWLHSEWHKAKLAGVLVGKQPVSLAAASRNVEAVQQCRTIKEPVVQETGKANRVAIVDGMPMPNGKIDALREIKRMHIRFACIEHYETDLGPRGCPTARIPIPTHDFRQNLAGFHRLSEELEPSSFVRMASDVESGWHLFANLYHYLRPL